MNIVTSPPVEAMICLICPTDVVSAAGEEPNKLYTPAMVSALKLNPFFALEIFASTACLKSRLSFTSIIAFLNFSTAAA